MKPPRKPKPVKKMYQVWTFENGNHWLHEVFTTFSDALRYLRDLTQEQKGEHYIEVKTSFFDPRKIGRYVNGEIVWSETL